jgi:CHAT domain-containing protein
VLIPSGRLGLLPLHAAALEDGRCLLDEFEVSYAPSAQALEAARASEEKRAAAPLRLAGVGNPLPNPQPLAFAGAELRSVVELLPAGSAAPLYERAATRAAVLAALRGATIAHLACHGDFAWEEPLNSGLQLGDGSLTLREILDHPEPFAAVCLAVLSACQTSVTDFGHLLDEAIGLPAGFLQAGVPGVIGTLWSVDDVGTALLMVRCYELMLGERMTACAALREAQRWLRGLTVADLEGYLDRHEALARAKRERMERMSAVLAHGLRVRALVAEDTDARLFADPVYWAPFTYSGAPEVRP